MEIAQKARDAEKLAAITDLHRKGWSTLRIAKHYSASCRATGQYMRRHGLIGGYLEAG